MPQKSPRELIPEIFKDARAHFKSLLSGDSPPRTPTQQDGPTTPPSSKRRARLWGIPAPFSASSFGSPSRVLAPVSPSQQPVYPSPASARGRVSEAGPSLEFSESSNSEASGSSSLKSQVSCSSLFPPAPHRGAQSELGTPKLVEDNTLGILNTPIVVTQQQKHISAAIQNKDSLAPFPPAKGAAGARKGSSDAQRRKKNRRVESAKKLIRNYGKGERPANREVSYCTLYLGEYRQLLDEISDDATLRYIFESRLRYDYTANNRTKTSRKLSKQFAVRMPTAFHERLSDEIDEAIKLWKGHIMEGKVLCATGMCPGQYCTDEHTKGIAKKLKGHRSESLNNSELKESDKKDPDLSYALEGYDTDDDDDDDDDDESDSDGLDSDLPRTNLLQWPGLVVEVGWSQSSSDLRQKCEWYIENSNGEVRTVIGVDLHDLFQCYPKPKTEPRRHTKRESNRATKKDIAKMVEATKKRKAVGKIFLWRAEMDNTNGAKAVLYEDKPQIFRDENGKPVGEVIIRLSLEDFISPRFLGKTGASHNPELVITPELLCDRFETALKAQILKDRELEKKLKEKKGKAKGPARENSTREGAQDESTGTTVASTTIMDAAPAPEPVLLPAPTQSTHAPGIFSRLRSRTKRK
ncbi:hypothetical protein O1611_g4931 [Lasiodiplodia mahajangana]|uniref:Uncharacterized protein n=1 Tax=Lasiodiplodia mahajangana TaxID=1108764 RepID=A0ACC2JMZ6_9PEZI|nr:hypothetical protein O1611_g4931 [Lasiodiplodia mahajangana]